MEENENEIKLTEEMEKELSNGKEEGEKSWEQCQV